MSAGEINPYAAPSTFVPLQVSPAEGLWHQGRFLLVRKGTPLPDRCVKCNAPADGQRLKRVFSWHHPAVFALALAALVVYVVVALVVRQSITLQVGVCHEHLARRRFGIVVGWCGFLGGCAMIALSWMPESRELFQLLLYAGLALLVSGPLFGLWRSQIVWARKVDKDFAWVGGVCHEYLAQLPLIDMPP